MILSSGILSFVNCYAAILCTLLIATCSNPLVDPFVMPYKLSEPDKVYTLQKSLNEVSGLNIVGENEAALVDDEKGSIFYYNLDNNTVVREVHFAEGGDWEDLLIKGDTSYVLKSDGTILEISQNHDTHKVLNVKKFDTALTTDNDTEGLCFDHEKQMLLIACKGKPYLKNSNEKYKGRRAIYGFSPVTHKLHSEPVYLIDIHKVESMLLGLKKNAIKRIMQLYSINTKVGFQPSGMSIHPLSRDIYIVSAVGNVLLVLNPEGHIRAAARLSGKEFKQPEGITFDKEGNLYISNEGKSGKGNILKFSYNENLIL